MSIRYIAFLLAVLCLQNGRGARVHRKKQSAKKSGPEKCRSLATKAERAACVCDIANGADSTPEDVIKKCGQLRMDAYRQALPWSCAWKKTDGVARCEPMCHWRAKGVDKCRDDQPQNPVVEERQQDGNMKDDDELLDDDDDLEEEEELATDCEGSWQEWSECSAPCGGGSQTRSYSITTQADGGIECPSSPESQPCNTQACPVDCSGSWEEWGECSRTCGGGEESRSFIVKERSAFGGDVCPSSPENRPCNTEACAVDCAGSWQPWGACSRTCGEGRQSRSFTVKSNAANGGEACPASPETQTCNAHDCPVNCAGTWEKWNECSVPCGGGQESRNFIVKQKPEHGGAACPSTPETQPCNTEACPVSCEGTWQKWSECSQPCGGGTQSRSFTIKNSAQNGGEECPASPATQACNAHACPVDCAGSWEKWGECSRTCGGGEQSRSFLIKQDSANGGDACPASPEVQSCNTNPCPVDCHGSWLRWSKCSQKCGGGAQTRKFVTKVKAAHGGASCPQSPESQECNSHACPVDCAISWPAWGSCDRNCGGGKQTRSYIVTTKAQNGGAACPSRRVQSQKCNENACGCQDKDTGFNDDGGGNSIYMDRHRLQCGGDQALTRWHLTRNSRGNNIRMEYQCCSLPAGLGSCREVKTRYNDDGNGQNIYLDRHDLRCGSGEVMNGWRLQRSSDGQKYRLRYNCCSAPALGACKGRNTPLNMDGGWGAYRSTVYFDRHDIRCAGDEAMSRWHLTRGGTHNKIKFDYTCCKADKDNHQNFEDHHDFLLQHDSKKCVHPYGGSDNPAAYTGLVINRGCTRTRDALKFRKLPGPDGYFVLQHHGGRCVVPRGGSDKPSRGTALVFMWNCDTSLAKNLFREIEADDGSFILQHRGGSCVHPWGGSDSPRDNTALVVWPQCDRSAAKLKYKKISVD